MGRQHTILMADVIGSREHEGAALASHLHGLVEAVNSLFKGAVSSSLTVTLGDEFQGIVANPAAGVDAILWIEHRLREQPLKESGELRPYQLRYVLHEGEIESPLNRERSHGMLGAGLTQARELLSEHRRDLPRFRMALADQDQSRRLSDLFSVLESLSDDWRAKDYTLIEAMLAEPDSELLGERFNRHRTSIDRRRQTLKIEAYLTLERLLRDLAS